MIAKIPTHTISPARPAREAGTPWLRPSIAHFARAVRQVVIAIRHRRQLEVLADRDDRMLADIGLRRSDLDAARAAPLTQDPTRWLGSNSTTQSNRTSGGCNV